MSKKKSYRWLLLGMVMIWGMVYLLNDSYYKSILKKAGLENMAGQVLEYQFDLIVDSSESTFWQAVYKNGRTYAAENNVLLELKGVGNESDYTKIDFMNMSIAAQADGIILEYNGEDGLEEKINEAVTNGIPVVTVMSDAPQSLRQSFVGVSDYQLGTAYGEMVARYLDETTENVLILTRRNPVNLDQSQLYTQLNNAALGASKRPEELKVSTYNLQTAGPFDAEEAIHEIFQQQGGPPDMLVCMDEEITECARQALIDFNLVGKVKIIGYYVSENILDAVSKGLICVTCNVDTNQLGQQSVQALVEYLRDGRVSIYNNVDVSFVDREKALAMERRALYEQDKVEESVSGK